MPDFEVFTIIFDKKLYFAGEKVTGNVRIVVGKEQKVRRIILRPQGICEVEWTNGKKKKSRHNKKKKFFELYQELAAHSDSMVIPRGEHLYPFVIDLPQNLPESKYLGEMGHHALIKYEVEVQLDIPWAFDKSIKMPFVVTKLTDLNVEECRRKVEGNGYKTFGICCFESKPLEMSVKLNKNGFVPGESIPVLIDIHNESGTSVQLRAKVVQTYKTFCNQIFSDVLTSIPINVQVTGDMKTKVNHNVKLPTCPLTSVDPSDPISLSYTIAIEVQRVSGLSRPFSVAVPITVGSIPHRESLDQFVSTPGYKIGPVIFPEEFRDMKLEEIASFTFGTNTGYFHFNTQSNNPFLVI